MRSTLLAPAFIGLLGELNLGSQLMAAAVLFLLAWYVLRMARIGSSIAAISATVVQVAVSIFIVAAIAVGFGWITPRPGAFLSDVLGVAPWVLELAADVVVELFEWLVEVLR